MTTIKITPMIRAALACLLLLTAREARAQAMRTFDRFEKLLDVQVTSKATGDYMTWNGTKWVNAVPPWEVALGMPSINGQVLASTTLGVRTWVTLPAGFSGAWADLTGKPSTFPPSAHTHPQSEVIGLVTSLTGKEASLGNPGSNGQVLSSTMLGVRTWVTLPAGFSGSWNDLADVPEAISIYAGILPSSAVQLFLNQTDEAGMRAKLGLGELATQNGTFSGTSSGTNTGDQDLSGYTLHSRMISTTAPLTGGGDLSANRTFAISAATTSTAGSLSAADKVKLDATSGTNSGDQNLTPYQTTAGVLALGGFSSISGTLADARLSANVPFLNAANVFTAAQQNLRLGIGVAADATRQLTVVGTDNFPVKITGSSGGGLVMGACSAGYGGIWPASLTPSTTNYALAAATGGTIINAGSGVIYFSFSDAYKMQLYASGGLFLGASGATDPGAGNLTVSGGTITGGASGLSLASGGTNQNITLTPSGTGKTVIGDATWGGNSNNLMNGNGIFNSGSFSVGTSTLNNTRGYFFGPSGGYSLGLQYFDANTLQISNGTSGTFRDLTLRSLLPVGGTVTADAPVINATQTWNNLATTFTGIKLNVTDTTSAAASKLIDLQVGGTSQFSVTKGGKVSFPDNLIISPVGGAISIARSGGGFLFVNANVQVYPFLGIKSDSGNTPDVCLYPDAVNVFALRNGTSAQKFRLYNTFTTLSTAGEWLDIDWQTTANVLQIGTQKGSSTGTARPLQINYGGTNTAAISVPITSGPVLFGGGLTAYADVTLGHISNGTVVVNRNNSTGNLLFNAGSGIGGFEWQTQGVQKVLWDTSGNLTIAGGFTIGTGALKTNSSGVSQWGQNLTFYSDVSGGDGGIAFRNGNIGSKIAILANDGKTDFYNTSANTNFTSAMKTGSVLANGNWLLQTGGTFTDNGAKLQVTGDFNASGAAGIGGTANANAILDVQSTTKAFMPPRMTTTQKTAIASPTEGMEVYDTTLHKKSVYTGTVWETVTSL